MTAGKAIWIVSKRTLFWGLALGVVLGAAGLLLLMVYGHDARLALWFAFGGGYLGCLFGLGQGIKACFGADGFDEECEYSQAEVDFGPMGNAIPGLRIFSAACALVESFAGWAKEEFKHAQAARRRRATLEGVAWAIFPLGIFVLAFAYWQKPEVLYGLFLVPVAAVLGAICNMDDATPRLKR